MTRRSRIAVMIVVIAIAAWWGASRVRSTSASGSPEPVEPPAAAHRTAGQNFSDQIARSRARSAKISRDLPFPDGDVTIAGRVIDIRQQQPVGNVEVVFHSLAGETSTMASQDGSYAIHVPPGMYRAFVRDDTVLSVARPERVRLPGLPSADAAGVPDEALMAIVLAGSDTEGVDLSVVRGGIVSGHVVDRNGRPIAGAVLRALGGGVRPTLATDIAETDKTGSFELRLPTGAFSLDASHPKFAGVENTNTAQITVGPGDHLQTTLTLTAGCIISGRVVAHDGKPAGDGAIEQQWGETDLQFGPAGRIEPDGTFRWVTTDEVDVTLRAWPWKSPPSPSQRFSCRDGARFPSVVFSLPERHPDIAGILVDKAGEPVGNAFVDLQPLDPGGIGQQERTDATGHWEVFHMPAGRYRITAQAESRGVTTQTVASPQTGVRLELGGTGRIEGTTQLATGSFELVLRSCLGGGTMIPLPQAPRLITIIDGHFTIDNIPACELSFSAVWRGKPSSQHLSIPSDGTAHIELALGSPSATMIHGVVRGTTGQPLAGALITATSPDSSVVTTTTDATGAYTIKALPGASLRAALHGNIAAVMLDDEDTDDQPIDLILDDSAEGSAADITGDRADDIRIIDDVEPEN